jgi:hypothetical protein
MTEITEPLTIEEGTILTIPEDAVLFYTDGLIDPKDLERAGLDLNRCVPVFGKPSEIIGLADRGGA